jgi:integrase
MASLRKSGRSWIIQFYAADKTRRTIRFGKLSKRDAEKVQGHIEDILNCTAAGCSLSTDTASWLGKISDAVHAKLSAVGLVESRTAVSEAITELAKFVDGYIADRQDVADNTLRNFRNARDKLVAHFGADRNIATINEGHADQWRQSMRNEGLATATIATAVKKAKQFFRAAVRRRLIAESPFRDVTAGSMKNAKRLVFVSRDLVDKAIAAAPNAEWRLIIALIRYGGLRCPSELLRLTWGDVDLENNRITVPSPKTEKQGKPYRIIPLFPELREHLEAVLDELLSDPEFDPQASRLSQQPVIKSYRDPKVNLRTPFLRILKRAGVVPWERLFQNLRASRETELSNDFPIQVVTEWLGNTPDVALGHYLSTRDEHFAKATAERLPRQQEANSSALRNALLQPPATSDFGPQTAALPESRSAKSLKNSEIAGFHVPTSTPKGSASNLT